MGRGDRYRNGKERRAREKGGVVVVSEGRHRLTETERDTGTR